MPAIPIYEAPQLGLTPSETGIDALQQAARRTGSFYGAAGEDLAQIGRRAGSTVKDVGDLALKSIEHHETAAGAKNYADMVAALTADWTQTAKNADPNDAGVAQRWREQKLEPALAQFAEKGFLTEGGQQWAQNHVAAFRQHMVEKNNSDMSTLAGVAAQANFAEVTNKLASTVRLDPSSLDFALKTADTSLGGIVDSSPTLSAGDAARVREEGLLKAREGIVKSAVIGMIEKNPNLDMSAIEAKYGQYMKPGEMSMLVNFQKQQAKQNFVLNKQIEDYARKQDDIAATRATSENFTKNFTRDPQTNLPIITPEYIDNAHKILMAHPESMHAQEAYKAAFALTQHYQQVREAEGQKVVTNPVVQKQLYDGLFNADKPTTDIDIMKAEANPDPKQRINAHDGATLMGLYKTLEASPLKGPVYESAIRGAAERAGVGLMNDGHERYAKFMQTFWPIYMKEKSAGVLQPNALDLRDENSLIRVALKQFEPTPDERLRAEVMKRLQSVGQPTTEPTAAPKPPTMGEVRNGYRFKGGDPALPASWEKI